MLSLRFVAGFGPKVHSGDFEDLLTERKPGK
jgi:hypothetical protein